MSGSKPVEKPRCSRCGIVKPASFLSGYDPLAKPGERYRNAYCTQLTKCDSEAARTQLEELAKHLK